MENQSPETPKNIPTTSTSNNSPVTNTPDINEIGLPPPSKPKFQFKSSIIWIVLIIIIVGLFFAGYGIGGFSKNNQVKSLRDQIEKLETEEEKLNNQIAELEKTVADLDLGIIEIPYQNYEYSYRFIYPSNLEAIDYSNTSRNNILGFELDDKTIAVIKVSRKQRPYDQYLNKTATDTLKIDGQEATTHLFPDGVIEDGKKSDPFIAYKVINGSNQYILEFYGGTKPNANQKRILSSFSFIDITTKSGIVGL
ncbi:hypothetical protein ACFL14_02325 [Patescibacteria group bacterium]